MRSVFGIILAWVLFCGWAFWSSAIPLFQKIAGARPPSNYSPEISLEPPVFLFSLITTALWLFGARAVGRRLTGLFKIRTQFHEEAALGLGAIGLSIFFLGLLGAFYKSPLVLLGILLAAFGAWSLRQNLPHLPKSLYKKGRFQFWILLIPFILNLPGALAPETFLDSLVYHLGLPNLYLIRHRIEVLPDNLYSGFPALSQMWSVLALAFQGDVLAKTFHFSMILIFGMSLWRLAEGCAKGAGPWAFLIFFSTPGLGPVLWHPTGDAACALFCLLALESALLYTRSERAETSLLDFPSEQGCMAVVGQYKESGSWARLTLSGIFWGLALSLKYTAVLVMLPILVLLATGTDRSLRAGLWFLALGLLVSSPWWIKNWVALGNPVYPYLGNFFGWNSPHPEGFKYFLEEQRHLQAPLATSALTLPYLLTAKADAGSRLIGPFFLAAAPLFFFARWISREMKLVVLLLYLTLATLSHVPRFWLLLFALLSIFAAGGLVSMKDQPGKVFRWTAAVFILANFTAQILLQHFYLDPWRVSVGLESRTSYLNRWHITHERTPAPAYFWMNAHLPKGSKALLVGESRGFHLKHDHEGRTFFDSPTLAELIRRERSEAHTWLKRNRFTHIFVNHAEMREPTRKWLIHIEKGDIEKLERLLKNLGRQIWKEGELEVWELFSG